MENQFHLAFKVRDIVWTIKFYHDILGCELGRQTEHWVDFAFFGHQLSAHVSDSIPELDYCGKVENLKVPIPHFGCILEGDVFNEVYKKLATNKVEFVFEPQTRYEGELGEQQTMFILDFSNNPIEFKSSKNPEAVFS